METETNYSGPSLFTKVRGTFDLVVVTVAVVMAVKGLANLVHDWLESTPEPEIPS